MTLNARSLANLQGVHPDLVAIVTKAAEKAPFLVTEGLRSLERQKKLKAAGKSRTLNSRHLTGHAVDLCDCDGCYDHGDMTAISAAMKDAAKELGLTIEWGGDWPKAWDTPHFQLAWKDYPAGNGGLSLAQKAVEAVKTKPAIATTAATVATTVSNLPAPPDLAPLVAWQGVGTQLAALGSWALSNPLISLSLIAFLGLTWFIPAQEVPENG